MKKIKRGKLIVIEGLDGSGKATQTKLLVQKLKREGQPVKTLDFPQYHTFFGKIVGKYLRGEFGQPNQVNPYFASFLYVLDRWQIKEKIKNWLKSGKIIVSNRYSTSNFLYQIPKLKDKRKKEKFRQWLEKLEFDFFSLPKPDLVIYLYTPYWLGQKFVKKKKKRSYLNGKKMDLHEKSSNYLKLVEKNSSELIKKYQWQKINCFQNNQILPKEEIAKKIWLKVKNFLKI